MVRIKKQQYYLWRAVDSQGNVVDVLRQRHRDTKAAKRLCTQTPKKTRFRATGNPDRQAQEVLGGEQASLEECGTSTTQGTQSPWREL